MKTCWNMSKHERHSIICCDILCRFLSSNTWCVCVCVYCLHIHSYHDYACNKQIKWRKIVSFHFIPNTVQTLHTNHTLSIFSINICYLACFQHVVWHRSFHAVSRRLEMFISFNFPTPIGMDFSISSAADCCMAKVRFGDLPESHRHIVLKLQFFSGPISSVSWRFQEQKIS